MAAVCKADAQCSCAMLALLAVVVLLFSPVAVARPVVSGWDVSLSTGSSDATLWRKFTTPGQAAGYHRLLLDLETSLKVQDVGETVDHDVKDTNNKIPSNDFNTMDYADPRSNKPGSSDQMTPPLP